MKHAGAQQYSLMRFWGWGLTCEAGQPRGLPDHVIHLNFELRIYCRLALRRESMLLGVWCVIALKFELIGEKIVIFSCQQEIPLEKYSTNSPCFLSSSHLFQVHTIFIKVHLTYALSTVP